VPQEFLSANDVDVRIPIGVLFLGIGMLQWNLPTMRMQYTFLAVVLLFALVRVGYIATIYFPFRNVVANLEESLQQVPLGSRVMIARPHDRHDVHSMVSLRQPEVIGLFYLPCLAMIERSSLVSIAHSHPAQQVLTVRPAFREFTGGYDDDPLDIADLLAGTLPIGSPPGKRLYWKDWTKHYDYLYLIWDSDLNNPAPDLLIQQYDGRNFRLYRVAS
jgi:hypothetical protein